MTLSLTLTYFLCVCVCVCALLYFGFNVDNTYKWNEERSSEGLFNDIAYVSVNVSAAAIDIENEAMSSTKQR